MALKLQLSAMTRIDFDTASLTTAYQTTSAGGFGDDLVILKLYNASDRAIDISLDGVNDHDFLPLNGTYILDCGTMGEGRRPAFPKGMQVFVKGASAGTGTIYIAGYTQLKG